jgi:hypothetical protein
MTPTYSISLSFIHTNKSKSGHCATATALPHFTLFSFYSRHIHGGRVYIVFGDPAIAIDILRYAISRYPALSIDRPLYRCIQGYICIAVSLYSYSPLTQHNIIFYSIYTALSISIAYPYTRTITISPYNHIHISHRHRLKKASPWRWQRGGRPAPPWRRRARRRAPRSRGG